MIGASSISAEPVRFTATRRWLQRLLRLLFAMLLLGTGVAKWLDIGGFSAVVESYMVFAQWLVKPAAVLLASLEVAIGLWLLRSGDSVTAAKAVMTLHLLYLIWILLALSRGLSLANCGCFGVYWPQPLTWMTPLEDLVLLSLALGLYHLSKQKLQSRDAR